MFSPRSTTNTSRHCVQCFSAVSSSVPLQPHCLLHIWASWTFSYKSCHGYCQFLFTFPPGPISSHCTPSGLLHSPYIPSKPSITHLGFPLCICEKLLPPIHMKLILYLLSPSHHLTSQLITGWTVLGWNPGGDKIFQTHPNPEAHPTSCTMGTRSPPWSKSSWGMVLTTHSF